MTYVIAAYGVTIATLVAYGVQLARERARLSGHPPRPSRDAADRPSRDVADRPSRDAADRPR